MKKTFNFDERTSEQVKREIERLHASRARVRVWYGDISTGEAWPEELDIIGRIGRSTGQKPIPLLVHNARSIGGAGLLDGCIVRIDLIETKHTLYKHPNFSHGVTVDNCTVLVDGKTHAVLSTTEKAQRLSDFLTGERYSK